MDLLAKRRVRILPLYFVGYYQTRHSILYLQSSLHQGSLGPTRRSSRNCLVGRTFSHTPLSVEGILTCCRNAQVFLIVWLVRENKLRRTGKRDHRLEADEATIAILGNRHPKFRLTI